MFLKQVIPEILLTVMGAIAILQIASIHLLSCPEDTWPLFRWLADFHILTYLCKAGWIVAMIGLCRQGYLLSKCGEKKS